MPLEAGVYRVNKMRGDGQAAIGIECSPNDGDPLPEAYIDYEIILESTR